MFRQQFVFIAHYKYFEDLKMSSSREFGTCLVLCNTSNDFDKIESRSN